MENVTDQAAEREPDVTHYAEGGNKLTWCGVDLAEVAMGLLTGDRRFVNCPGCAATLVDEVIHFDANRLDQHAACSYDLDRNGPEGWTTDPGKVTCAPCASTLVDEQLAAPDATLDDIQQAHEQQRRDWTNDRHVEHVASQAQVEPERRTVSLEVLTDELRAVAAETCESADERTARAGIVFRIDGMPVSVPFVDTDWAYRSGAEAFASLVKQAQLSADYDLAELLMPTPDVLAALDGTPNAALVDGAARAPRGPGPARLAGARLPRLRVRGGHHRGRRELRGRVHVERLRPGVGGHGARTPGAVAVVDGPHPRRGDRVSALPTRADYVAGLRELADLLEATDLPLPTYQATLSASLSAYAGYKADDEASIAQVGRAAQVLGVEVVTRDVGANRHHTVDRVFGPIELHFSYVESDVAKDIPGEGEEVAGPVVGAGPATAPTEPDVWIARRRNGILYHPIDADPRYTVCGRAVRANGSRLTLADAADLGAVPCPRCYAVPEG